ncbi:YtxH domain-containing protein [Arthrobacter sp. UYCu712]|uniref:YtxH domain-containing protein n=1 Tax=Arthrobacter sp. UYCu712 TaxID=3156340 RepID=UPI0033995053
MKAKLLFGAGMAAGYILGSRSGRAAYEKLKSRAAALWESKPVQDKLTAAAEAVKDKAPEVSDQLSEAARRAATVIGSAVRHEDAPEKTGVAAPEGSIPAHGTHPDTVNLGTAASAAPDVESDPALNDEAGQDWSDEGGATPAGAATNVDPNKLP